MRRPMRACLAALFLVLSFKTSLFAANPLTPAEQTICQNLRQCLSILERHPQDSFNYAHLNNAFEQFGKKGQKALIKLLLKGDEKAGHAADLIALSADEGLLTMLRDQETRRKAKDLALVDRTVTALASRVKGRTTHSSVSSVPASRSSEQSYCQQGVPVELIAQRREMPFFEADIARPDPYGAYRPSAPYQIAARQTERRDLNSAVSIVGGWLAGYSGGLVHYRSETGAPTLLSRAPIISLQRLSPDRIDDQAWIISATSDTLIISLATDESMISLLSLKGSLLDLRRTPEGALILVTSAGKTVQLRKDGSYIWGCLT